MSKIEFCYFSRRKNSLLSRKRLKIQIKELVKIHWVQPIQGGGGGEDCRFSKSGFQQATEGVDFQEAAQRVDYQQATQSVEKVRCQHEEK